MNVCIYAPNLGENLFLRFYLVSLMKNYNTGSLMNELMMFFFFSDKRDKEESYKRCFMITSRNKSEKITKKNPKFIVQMPIQS